MKNKEKKQLLIILCLLGVGYYFFIYLPSKRDKTKEEIKVIFQLDDSISPASLNNNLWKGSENWEKHLDSLYLSSQINQFARRMKSAINEKIREKEEEKSRKRKAREKAIEEIEKICDELVELELENKTEYQVLVEQPTQ